MVKPEQARRGQPRQPSRRQVEVVSLIAAGDSTAEMAVRLGITTRTVKTHVERMFDRYGVTSRAELVALAARRGWLVERAD